MAGIVSVQRLTLFSLIYAIEDDLKILIASLLNPATLIDDIYGTETCTKARTRKEKDHNSIATSDDDLLDYFDLGDHLEAVQRNKALLNLSARNLISTMSKQMTDMVPVRNRVMHNRPLDFSDLPTISALAKNIVQSDTFNWFKTRELLQSLKRDIQHTSFALTMISKSNTMIRYSIICRLLSLMILALSDDESSWIN